MASALGRFRLALASGFAAIAVALGRGAYRAGDMDRSSSDWRPRKQRADAAWLPQAELVNARARDIVRNEGYAQSAVGGFARNVVGCGMTVMPARTLPDGRLDTAWNEAAAAAFEEWAEDHRLVDRERKRTFAEVQDWALRETVVVGGALAVWGEEDRGPGVSTLYLQLFEYEQLDRTISRFEYEPGQFHEVRAGVEIDEYGAAVAFHLTGVRETPGTVSGVRDRSERVPADRVIHVFEPGRARQTLSEGRFASVLQRIRNLHAYDRSTLAAARLEASAGLVIKVDDAQTGLSGSVDKDGEAKKDELEASPINVFRLQPGEDVEPFEPSRPGGGYADFIKVQIRAFAAGIGLSYELVARDFTLGSYSAQRQALLEDRREFRKLQKTLTGKLCTLVYQKFIELAVRDGILRAPEREFARNPRAWQRVAWMADGFEWIDPESEATANKLALESRLTTRAEILALRGKKWEHIAKQLRLEQEFDESIGLAPPGSEATRPSRSKEKRDAA